jgi:predicted TIM-barrel fold metal-dependent hydrolase
LAFLVAAASIVGGTAAAAAGGGFIDTHMHIHPLGLDAVMSPGAQSGRPGDTMRPRPEGRAAMTGPSSGRSARQRPTMGNGRPPRFGGGGGDRREVPDGGSGDFAAKLAQAADNLVVKMDRQGLDSAMVVVVPSGRQSGEEIYRAMRDAQRRHPGRLFLMAGGATLGPMIRETAADRVTADVRRRFEERAEEVLRDGAKGFGEMISYHLCMTKGHSFQYAPADHPLFLLLADIAARHDVPIDLHMEAAEQAVPTSAHLRRACDQNPATIEPTVPALERLLRHNRDARVVWQHIGWDNVGQMRIELLRRMLATHPNLSLALRVAAQGGQAGAVDARPNRIVDEAMRLRPEWQAFIVEFQDRVMIGADEFVSPVEREGKLAQSFSETWSIVDQLPPEVARKVGRDNAARVYRLN